MSVTIEKAQKYNIPVIPMKGIVAFPMIPISFEILRDESVRAFEKATSSDSYVLLCAQRDISVDEPKESDLYKVGTIVKIKQSIKTAEKTVRVLAEGISRATITSIVLKDGMFTADVIAKTVNVADNGGAKAEALIRVVGKSLKRQLDMVPNVPGEFIKAVDALKDPGLISDFISSNILVSYEDKQFILEEYDPIKRLEKLCVILEQQAGLLRTEVEIHRKVKEKLDKNQRIYYLREQLRIIQDELNEEDDSDYMEYLLKIRKSDFPEHVKEKLEKETRKLEKVPFASAESTVIRSYLDTCLEFPWSKMSKERNNIETAKRILEKDHYGIKKVKERILEYIAVKQNAPELKNQTLCLVGAPGVGKTSVAISVARALNRKFVRISLGGVRDEAEIRGHRKTYIGSMPGRIADAIIKAGVKNPLILLDEVDKMTSDIHGDPSSALLEVLDGEQNKAFRDHYLEIPIDLSECIFIATANSLEGVSPALIDRMEVIEMNSYTSTEKIHIAKDHLIPKQMKRHGISARQLKITDDALTEIINSYTNEAGVRNLEREIASICRKAAKDIVENGTRKVVIKAEDVKEYLGSRKKIPDRISESDEIGEVNGLAYTAYGGDVLKIEAEVLDGSGNLELTGSLGDVMKESAKAAVTYIRARTEALGIEHDFYKTKDLHIHVPEGAVPKDGPSAGVSIATAIVSALSGRKVKHDVAMTGEITLRGKVIAIGGLREKTMAAYKAGIRTVLFPKENLSDLEDSVEEEVKSGLEFIPCSTLDDILANALSEMIPEIEFDLGSEIDGLEGKSGYGDLIPENDISVRRPGTVIN